MLRATTIEKHFAFFMLSFVLMLPIYAQENGPTKEQTQEYIKGYFSALKIIGTNEGERIKWDDQFQLSFNDCNLIIEWNHYAWDGSLFYKPRYEFDIRDIESLGVSLGEMSEDKYYGILFLAINSQPLIKEVEDSGEKYVSSFDLPIYQEPNQLDVEESKIFKAFNHLRKLCDAPDPISFD